MSEAKGGDDPTKETEDMRTDYPWTEDKFSDLSEVMSLALKCRGWVAVLDVANAGQSVTKRILDRRDLQMPIHLCVRGDVRYRMRRGKRLWSFVPYDQYLPFLERYFGRHLEPTGHDRVFYNRLANAYMHVCGMEPEDDDKMAVNLAEHFMGNGEFVVTISADRFRHSIEHQSDVLRDMRLMNTGVQLCWSTQENVWCTVIHRDGDEPTEAKG